MRWRTVAKHHETQQRCRDEVFQDYHLRVGEIVLDTAPPRGTPIVELRLDETEIGTAKFVTLDNEKLPPLIRPSHCQPVDSFIARNTLPPF